MLSTGKKLEIVGLDLEAGSAAAVEVASNGQVAVTKFGTAALPPGALRDGEVADPDALSGALKDLFASNRLSKNARLGLASQRVAVRTLQLPAIEDAKELKTAIEFQAQDQIPMPLDQAVLDWQVVGHTTGENGEQMVDVVVVAARREAVHGVVSAMRQAGLRPVGIDLAAFGMIRALASNGGSPVPVPPGTYVDAPGQYPSGGEDQLANHPGEPSDEATGATDQGGVARVYCNLGDVTNLAVARGSRCMFTRISPFGLEGIAQKLAERRELTLEHARQWLAHVGLEAPLEGIEGDPEIVAAARDSLTEGASRLVDELRLSLEYYGAQADAMPVDGVVACGPGTTIPGLTERLQRDLGQRFEIGRPPALAHLDAATAARLTVSFGLGLEE
jgi:type IV pilus assembly protein PilM